MTSVCFLCLKLLRYIQVIFSWLSTYINSNFLSFINHRVFSFRTPRLAKNFNTDKIALGSQELAYVQRDIETDETKSVQGKKIHLII